MINRSRILLLAASVLTTSALVAMPDIAAAWQQHGQPQQQATHQAPGQGMMPAFAVSGQGGTVPIELFRGNRIFLDSKVNGQPVRALLDTGASGTVLDRAYARSIGLPEGQKIVGRGAGGPVEAEIVSGVTMEVGGLTFTNLSVGVMDLSGVSKALGRPMPIVIGRDFFNSAAVGIDWDRSRLTVTPHARFTPPAGAQELAVERRGPFNFVKLGVAGLPPIDALLDLGNGGAINLPSDYWEKQPTLAALPFAETRSGGVGGLHATRAVTLPSVTFAGRTFERVPAIFSGDSQGGNAAHGANLGIGMLRQFDMVMDLGRNRLFLTPRAELVPFQRDRAGIRTEQDGSALTVSFVSPQGPAAKAGLKQGDRIVAVNGTPVGADFLAQGHGAWSMAEPGSQITLGLADGRTVAFRLADFY